MFLSKNKKNNVYPCKPQFYNIKVGFIGVKIIKVCFRNRAHISEGWFSVVGYHKLINCYTYIFLNHIMRAYMVLPVLSLCFIYFCRLGADWLERWETDCSFLDTAAPSIRHLKYIESDKCRNGEKLLGTHRNSLRKFITRTSFPKESCQIY